MSTCADFMSYRCVAGCKHFSRDLPENCAVCEFNTGVCVDCVSVTDCAQRPNFALAERYQKMKCSIASVYGEMCHEKT